MDVHFKKMNYGRKNRPVKTLKSICRTVCVGRTQTISAARFRKSFPTLSMLVECELKEYRLRLARELSSSASSFSQQSLMLNIWPPLNLSREPAGACVFSSNIVPLLTRATERIYIRDISTLAPGNIYERARARSTSTNRSRIRLLANR